LTTSLDGLRAARDAHYQEYLRAEATEIEGVVDTLAELKDIVLAADPQPLSPQALSPPSRA
jgi:hypothetical protein